MEDTDRIAKAVEGLVALIKSAPEAVVRAIAFGDSYAYEHESEKSLVKLREVIDDLDCRLEKQPDNSWHPREPIELVSYGVDGQSDHDTAVANALLMISDLETNDYGYMDFRWTDSPGQAWFEGLPSTLGAPLLAGMAVLRDRWREEGSYDG